MSGYYNYGWQGGAGQQCYSNSGYGYGGQQCYSNYDSGGCGNVFVLIVVLFILLIIVGSVII